MRRGVLVLISAILLTGCGGGSSSASSHLKTRATRICTAANRRLQRVAPRKGGYATFLQEGLAVLQPELQRLESLHADTGSQTVYAGALNVLGREIAAVKRARSALNHHQDPALAFAALERRLAPLESQANGAWRALQIPACVSR